MTRKVLIAPIIVIIVLAVSFTGGLYETNQTNPSPKVSPTPQVSPSVAPVIGPIQSLSNYYLQYDGNESRIFVVSANASYDSYPGPTVTSPPYATSDFGTAQHGEPCVTINITLRNDYSAQNPPPNSLSAPIDNSTLVYIGFEADIFEGNTKINATDITNALPVASFSTNHATASLDYGESTTFSIYLATNSTDVTSFDLQVGYLGLLLPP